MIKFLAEIFLAPIQFLGIVNFMDTRFIQNVFLPYGHLLI